jgi:hypothetical protein
MRKGILFLLFPLFGHAQVSEKNIKYDFIVTVNGNSDEYKAINQSTSDEDVLQDLYNLYFRSQVNVQRKNPKNPGQLISDSEHLADNDGIKIFADNKGKLDNDVGIILVRYAYQKKDATQKNKQALNTLIIGSGDKGYTTYLWNKRRILIIMLDETVYADSISIKNQPSFFLKSFQAAVSAAVQFANVATPVTTRLVYIDRSALHPPADISYSVPVMDNKNTMDVDNGPKKKETVTIHERNHFAFTIGLNASLLNAHNFSVKNDTVSISLDSAQKKSLKSAISIALEWYPYGRDIDNFSPIWQNFGSLWQRIGITGGVSLTNDPLQSFYIGGVVSISKYCSIVLGSYFVNDYNNNQSLGVSTVSSVSSLQDYFHRSYHGNFYFGITLAPSVAIKSLTSKSSN